MAAEKVKERLRRATRALDDAGVRYAVAGGNAVAEWVGRVDEEAVRDTRDIQSRSCGSFWPPFAGRVSSRQSTACGIHPAGPPYSAPSRSNSLCNASSPIGPS